MSITALTNEKRQPIRDVMSSSVILCVLALQVAAAVRPVIAGKWDQTGYLWPFLDFPMFSAAHYEGEIIPQYLLTGHLANDAEVTIQPSDLGLDWSLFRRGPIPALLRQDMPAVTVYRRLYEQRHGQALRRLTLARRPWVLSKTGARPGTVTVLQIVTFEDL